MTQAAQGQAVFLLPAWSGFGGQSPADAVAAKLGRADLLPPGEPGSDAQRLRHCVPVPARWAPAALTRQIDVGDAAGAAWLRLDPAHVRADMNGARLLGVGARLGLSREDADALLPALRPIFGDSGFALDAPAADRWYLRIAREATLPRFSDPDAALGEDPFDHQPEGDDARRWRTLLSEAQIVLHNHPWNATRAERGLVSINALWAWGGGTLPTQCTCAATRLHSDDEALRAFAACAGRIAATLPVAFAPDDDGLSLYDLRRMRDLAALQRDWLAPAFAALDAGTLATLDLDAADGTRLRLARSQRWRFWRRAWTPPRDAATDAGA
ncbi:MAG: phosphoglycerate mutase [Lysobacteraceae bacterium]